MRPLLLLLLLAAPATADPADLKEIVREVRKLYRVPAMGGAIVGPDGLIAIGVDGIRRVGDATPVSVDDRWHLGSCTKAMTATLIARLVEREKLAWDSTLGATLGKRYPKLHADARAITLLELLGHRSGLRANPTMVQMLALVLGPDAGPARSRRWVLDRNLRDKPDFPRNARFHYSNFGYTVAGAMAEEAGGKPWEQLIRDELFVPLGMKSAGFGAPGKAGTPPDQPRAHRNATTPVEPGRYADNPQAIGPAGTVHCSLRDWARFTRLHLRAALGQPKLLLEPASFARLHRPLEGLPHYAPGWLVHEPDWGAGKVLAHSGSNTMWFCSATIVPGRRFAILITCNLGGEVAGKACGRLQQTLIRHAMRHAR